MNSFRKTLFAVIGLIVFNVALAQPPGVKELKKGDCNYKPVYSKEQRRKNYPFNEIKTIEIISFRYHWNDYPVTLDSINRDSVLESRKLISSEVDQLTDILYNNFRKSKGGIITTYNCFYPRNAIVFLDSNGKVKECLFLCFECEKTSSLTNNEILRMDRCNQMMGKLQNFFRNLGIKHGTNPKISQYPGETFSDPGIITPKQ